MFDIDECFFEWTFDRLEVCNEYEDVEQIDSNKECIDDEAIGTTNHYVCLLVYNQ